MRINMLLLLIVASLTPSFAQKKELKVKFGKLTEKEIAMTSYVGDLDAPAVILFDKGDVQHRYDETRDRFQVNMIRHVRLKIFKKEAVNLADIAIFHHKSDEVSEIKAICYNAEGGKMIETKLEKENIFHENITKNFQLTKFSVPAVREGSIVEYTYTIEGMPDGWDFQRVQIPTIWSEFKASVPSFIEFKKFSQGWVPLTYSDEGISNENFNFTLKDRSEGRVATTTFQNISVTYQSNKMHFIEENVPGLKPEPYTNCAKDYISKISFDIQTIYDTDIVPAGTTYRIVNTTPTAYNRSWSGLGKELLEDVYEDDLAATKNTAADAASCTAGKTSIVEKMGSIYQHIGSNYQLQDFNRMWMSQDLSKLVKDHKGTATDLNILFINMARSAGMNAWPVLISTTNNGRIIPFSVSTDQFNKVIAAVEQEDSTVVLVDLTGFPGPHGLLPATDLNVEGLSLRSKDEVTWIPLQSKVNTKTAIIANLTVLEEGGASGKVTYMESGYGAVKQRHAIQDNNADAAFRQHFKDWFAEGSLSNLVVDKPDAFHESSFKSEFGLETATFATAAGTKIYLAPLQGLGMHENPFKNPERQYHVDLGAPNEHSFNMTFKLPVGYKVESAPKGAKLVFGENELLFDYIVEQTADQVKIITRLRQKQQSIPPDQYPQLQQFFSAMTSKMEEQVVLTKI